MVRSPSKLPDQVLDILNAYYQEGYVDMEEPKENFAQAVRSRLLFPIRDVKKPREVAHVMMSQILSALRGNEILKKHEKNIRYLQMYELNV